MSGFTNNHGGVSESCPLISFLVVHFLPGNIVSADWSFFNLDDPDDLFFGLFGFNRCDQRLIELAGVT